MAFIRRKKVHCYEYCQVVRNYRDGEGKHRQEMLDHLGRYDTIEAAIAFRKGKATFHQEQARVLSKRADDLKEDLQELYSDDLGGEIPSEYEAWEAWNAAYDEWYYSDHDPYSDDGLFHFERLEIEMKRAKKTIDYHGLRFRADRESASARRWLEKLNHLLDIQATYF